MRPLSVLSPVSRLAFSAKQETEINSIHQLVVGATENVKEGNEDIREVKFTDSGIRGARRLFRRCQGPSVSTDLITETSFCVLSLQAIKNNAGFRVWILFFLVMCSFSLLFLDWYDS